MSWHYLQALAGDYLDQSKQDTRSSVQSSGNPTASSPFNKDRETDTFRPSPSGTMSTPSTGHSGVDAWISSLLASPASPSQLLENSELARIQEMAGPPPFESFGKLDQNGSCLRTYQRSLLDPMGTCTEYAESWPRAAMILGGIAYLRTPVAPLMRGTGSGSLATPTATANQLSPSMMKHPGCRAIAKKENWPTPISHMNKESGCESEGRRREPTLTWLAHNRWPTPNAADNRPRGNPSDPSIQNRAQVGKHVSLSQSCQGTLNPDWVELLMGWPMGWTSLEPLPPGMMEDWLALDNYWPHDWEGDTPRTGKKANNSSRLKAIGNGQVPACVVKAWRLLR